ncbi:MAG: trigger factor [Nitrospinota bacterium]|jgi:trigger factor|nr:trigger factor [Nitrospinota bacterium]HJN02403.1 trigger factor [Nitrospinota bacterium]
MKIDIKEIGPYTKQLKIEIPLEIFSQEEEDAYRELGKKVKVPGFRKGKIPKSYLKKLYHDRVKGDVLNKIIPEAYYKAVEEKDLKPVGSPKLENIKHEENSPITFSATIEIIPPFEIKKYEGLKFTKKIAKITDEDIEREFDYIKNRYATFEEVTSRPAKEGDLVVVDFKGFVDGSSVQKEETKNYSLIIGANNLLEDFEKGFIGLNKNVEKEFTVTYPASHANKDLANKKVLFKVKVNEIKIKKLSEITDEFIKNEMGKEKTVAELREEIRQHQEKRGEAMSDTTLYLDVINKLIEMNPFEIPQVLIEDQINFMAKDFKDNMRLRGMKDDSMKIEREEFSEDAVRVVKGELIRQKISEIEKIEIDKTEIERELEKIAAEKKMAKEKLRVSMQKDNSYNNFLNGLQRKKTMDVILSKLTIKEVLVDRNELDTPS